jgi:hypothetical protein
MNMLKTLTIFAALTVVTSTTSADGPLAAVWRDFNLSYHRNHCWPHPFLGADNLATRAPMAAMMDNGWRLQNLIGPYHFEPDMLSMNEAGRRRVHWILTQAPTNRRVVFVERGFSAQETELRLKATRDAAQYFMPSGQQPDVRETHIVSQGTPAQYIDEINTKFNESTPEPRLGKDKGARFISK